MAYLIEPINEPYDAEEPYPTTMGFTADSFIFGGDPDLKREFKLVLPTIETIHTYASSSGDFGRMAR